MSGHRAGSGSIETKVSNNFVPVGKVELGGDGGKNGFTALSLQLPLLEGAEGGRVGGGSDYLKIGIAFVLSTTTREEMG